MSEVKGLDQSDPSVAAMFKRMNDEGIFMFQIPTPFAVGPVNCYLIEDDPLTLIDPGPNSGDSLEVLENELRAHGRELEDIEQIIVTHHHIDHIGLVEIVQSRSGAPVTCLDHCQPKLENFSTDASAADRWAFEIMLEHGLPQDTAIALRSVSKAFRGWGSSAKVDNVLHDGDQLKFRDRTLDVFYRPGHSISDTVFWNSDTSTLIAADHLIKKISSNPLLERPLKDGDPRPQELVTYLESMKKTREMPASIVLSGHGEPIEDHVTLIDDRFAMHDKRVEKLFGLLSGGPKSAHELARETWGNIAVTQAFLTLSEVIGHLDILVNAGRVAELHEDGLTKYALAA
ncbi:MAG TPA: MBL fold metallo-hydrolase [Solirubrobacterales bacterium]|nr:MBL fold metallo-hydrolase [Solirubrobacterales bacterium]